MKKAAQARAFSVDSTAKEISDALFSKWESEWLYWEPETLFAEIRRVFKVALSDPLRNKVQAVKTLHTTNAPWVDHRAFEKVVVALNGIVPLFDQYQMPSAAQVAKAIVQANRVRKVDFSDEVLRYIAVVAYDEGLVILPKPLNVAQESLDQLTGDIVGSSLRNELARAWEVNGSRKGGYTETVTGIHTAKLAAIDEFSKG